MEDYKSIINESKNILSALYDGENIKPISSQDQLRENLMSFISNQLGSIARQDVFRNLIEAELINKILLHEMSSDELMDMYKMISGEKAKTTTALLEPFKPTNSTSNPLLNPPGEDADTEEMAKKLTPNQRQTFNKLGMILEMLDKKEKEREEKE
jgi:hypothetical protein